MNLFHVVLLGLIQGFTEFLPVSSSGHLALCQSILTDFKQPGLLYDTLLHLATLFAVTVYFRRRIGRLFLAVLGIFMHKYKVVYHDEKNMLWGILIATIPTGIIGFALKDLAENMFQNTTQIGYMLIITSVMLFFSNKQLSGGKVTPLKAFIVGVSQGLAVFPGLSRSGTTIFMGLKTGISREDAAEFSFLISMPAILGATLLQVRHIDEVSSSDWGLYLVGMVVAFLAGLVAINWMIALVKKAKLQYFAVYCLLAGIATIVWL